MIHEEPQDDFQDDEPCSTCVDFSVGATEHGQVTLQLLDDHTVLQTIMFDPDEAIDVSEQLRKWAGIVIGKRGTRGSA